MEFFSDWLTSLGTVAKVGDVEHDMPPLFDEHTRIVTKETTPGKFETYFECCNRMVGFKNTLKEAANIYTRIYQEYGHRARLAQTNEGIDWKALSHAVRVANEALELLETHHVTFPLPNAAHILAIKRGTVPYTHVADEIEGLLVAVEKASESSDLRDTADQGFIDDLIKRVHGHVVMKDVTDGVACYDVRN
jgi:hypothetical protein